MPTSKYLDAGYIRPVVMTGIAFEVVGMVLTSFCNEFWQLALAQGVCVGIGCGMLAFTSAAVIPFYFTKRRMLAAGCVSTGSSIGKYITSIYHGKVGMADMAFDIWSSLSPHDARTFWQGWLRMGSSGTKLGHASHAVHQFGAVEAACEECAGRVVVQRSIPTRYAICAVHPW